MQSAALEALQEATETFIVNMFEDVQLCSIHAGRVTIYRKDLLLAMRIRNFNYVKQREEYRRNLPPGFIEKDEEEVRKMREEYRKIFPPEFLGIRDKRMTHFARQTDSKGAPIMNPELKRLQIRGDF